MHFGASNPAAAIRVDELQLGVVEEGRCEEEKPDTVGA
jgi:hypothetical protein